MELISSKHLDWELLKRSFHCRVPEFSGRLQPRACIQAWRMEPGAAASGCRLGITVWRRTSLSFGKLLLSSNAKPPLLCCAARSCGSLAAVCLRVNCRGFCPCPELGAQECCWAAWWWGATRWELEETTLTWKVSNCCIYVTVQS